MAVAVKVHATDEARGNRFGLDRMPASSTFRQRMRGRAGKISFFARESLTKAVFLGITIAVRIAVG